MLCSGVKYLLQLNYPKIINRHINLYQVSYQYFVRVSFEIRHEEIPQGKMFNPNF